MLNDKNFHLRDNKIKCKKVQSACFHWPKIPFSSRRGIYFLLFRDANSAALWQGQSSTIDNPVKQNWGGGGNVESLLITSLNVITR